jgi:hypothetical protein
MRNNPVLNALRNEKEYLDNIFNSTTKFFNENKDIEVLWDKNGRTLKAYRDDENKLIYLIDKKEKELTIHVEQIYDFNQKKSIKGIINFDIMTDSGCKLDKIYTNTILEFGEPKGQIREDVNLLDVLKEIFAEKADEMFGKYKFLFGDDFVSNPQFLEYVGLIQKIDCTSDISSLNKYSQLLNNLGYMKEKYPISFFENLNIESNKEMLTKLPGLVTNMNFLVRMCKEHNFKNKKNAFVFNDLDNEVWLEKGKLTVVSQNVGFYFDILDDNNFTVYFLDKEYISVNKEINRIKTAISEGTIDKLTDIALEIKDGKIKSLNQAYMYSFEFDMDHSAKAMEEEGLGEQKFAVDIHSYKYQKDYYCVKYKLSEFEFLAQTFLTLGGGADYNKEKGEFVFHDIKYVPNLKEAPDTRNDKVEKFNYCAPKKVSYLNDDWLEGLKYMVSVLKNDKPVPLVHYSKSPEQAVEKAIKMYEAVIKSNEKKAIKIKM